MVPISEGDEACWSKLQYCQEWYGERERLMICPNGEKKREKHIHIKLEVTQGKVTVAIYNVYGSLMFNIFDRHHPIFSNI